MLNRRLFAPRPPGSPPAVWVAFAAQGRWKSWVMAGQLAVLVLLVLANVRIARTEPDVVLVEPDGRSTYVARAVAGDALLGFLATQRQQPTDAEVVHFTKEFLELALAVNSSTVHEAWPRALSMMDGALKARWEEESARQNLIPGYQLAQVRTQLAFEDLALVARTESLLHVRARVQRVKSRLLDGASEQRDSLDVELVARVRARGLARPAGLEIAEWTVRASGADSKAAPHSKGALK